MNTVTLIGKRVVAEPTKAMRVRAGSGVKTDLNVLARAEQKYEFGKPSEMVKNTNFNAFDYKIVDKKMIATTRLSPMRHITTVKSVGTFDGSIIASVNSLLRNTLLFKGIGFAEVERELKLFNIDTRPAKLDRINKLLKNCTPARRVSLNNAYAYWKNTKPFAYYRTSVDVWVTLESGTVVGIHIPTIVVRKTFRNTVNIMGKLEEECSMMFDSKFCQGIGADKKKTKLSIWLDSLTMNF